MIVLIFRRDFRITDNDALNYALKYSKEKIYPVFLMSSKQLDPVNNKLHNNNCIQVMFRMIETMEIKIHTYYGDEDVDILSALHKEKRISAVIWNKDVTPFAHRRDKVIIDWCQLNGIHTHETMTYTLFTDHENIKPKTSKFYQVFTPFKNRCLLLPISKPHSVAFNKSKILKRRIKLPKYTTDPRTFYTYNPNLQSTNKDFKVSEYKELRNIPSIDGTSRLSIDLKFGKQSVREVWYRYNDETFRSELLWREFYYYLLHFNPKLLKGQIHGKNSPMKLKYDQFPWLKITKSTKTLVAWKMGETGVPIVDAGMREMNTTGWMHNRVRMIVAMYLTKILQIDWRLGEKYFATQLIDYDPVQNNGGWQWSSSTGADSQPYFRIFNPYLQAKRFDPMCLYIRKWVTELKDVSPKDILRWDVELIRNKYEKLAIKYYPIVDYKIMRKNTLEKFKLIK